MYNHQDNQGRDDDDDPSDQGGIYDGEFNQSLNKYNWKTLPYNPNYDKSTQFLHHQFSKPSFTNLEDFRSQIRIKGHHNKKGQFSESALERIPIG